MFSLTNTTREHAVTINGLESRVTLEYWHETVSASGIVFDDAAGVVTSVYGQRYSGYCDYCVITDTHSVMLVTRRQVEHDDVYAAVAATGAYCQCD